MAGPWEQYRAAPDGPWSQYANKRPRTAREDTRAPDAEASPREQARRRLQGDRTRAGVTNALGQSFGFGLGDEAAGAASALSNVIVGGGADVLRSLGVNVSPNVARFEPGAAFERGRQEFLSDIEYAERTAPNASTVANVLGMAGNIAMPTRALSRTSGLGAQVRAGVRQGAVAGTISGAGYAEGGIGERAAGAGLGAAAGVVGGAVVPVSINVAGSAVRGAQRLAGRGPSVAPQIVGRALTEDGGIRRATQMVEEAQARGVPMALGDTGDNARAYLASVGRQPGEARTIVRDMAISRQEAQGERIAGAITRDLGPVANVRATSEALAEQARQQAAPLYEAAYRDFVPLTDELQSLLTTPAGRQALQRAQTIAANERIPATELQLDIGPNGEWLGTQAPTIRTLDLVKRALDDIVEAERSKFTGRLELDTAGRAVNDVRQNLVRLMDASSDNYRQARATFAGPTRMRSALEKGRKSLNATADDLFVMTRDLTPAEAEQFKLGFRSAMIERIEGMDDYAAKIKTFVGPPKKRAALEQLFGGQAELDRFLATLADEARLSQTYTSVTGNSLTREREAFDAATGDSGLLNTAAGAATDVARGNLGVAVTRIIADLRNYGAGEAGKRARAEVAAALAETDPAVLRQALRDAARAQAGERVRLQRAGRGAVRQGQAVGTASGEYINRLMAPADERNEF
jgi:hypothetical protein